MTQHAQGLVSNLHRKITRETGRNKRVCNLVGTRPSNLSSIPVHACIFVRNDVLVLHFSHHTK